MSATDPSELLRANLLEGVTIALAGPPAPPGGAGESLASAVAAACAALGARVWELPPVADDGGAVEEAALEAAGERVLGEAGSIELLAVDGAGLFAYAAAHAAAGERARTALHTCLQASWSVTRAIVTSAFLKRARGGRIVYLAPAPDAGEHADAARAGLENLARTLSIEWARHGITTVTIAPGASTTAGEVAALTAYLASPAGAYFSGCLLDLRGPAGA